jgi:hypothetical protein
VKHEKICLLRLSRAATSVKHSNKNDTKIKLDLPTPNPGNDCGTCTISESGENCRICYSTCSIIPSFEVEFFDKMVNLVIFVFIFHLKLTFQNVFHSKKTLN